MNHPKKEHWESIYTKKRATEVSWYESGATKSLALIRATGVAVEVPVIDVGGGASILVDQLLSAGYSDVSVLDIAGSALQQARVRLGSRANRVKWIQADILDYAPDRRYVVWHDRAVFHFLTDERSRFRYLSTLRAALMPGGHLVLATFGPDGPQQCSGLPVVRYATVDLSSFLGPQFNLRVADLVEHRTPRGITQQYLYSLWETDA